MDSAKKAKGSGSGSDGVKYVVLDSKKIPAEPTAELISGATSDTEEVQVTSESSGDSNADADKPPALVGMTCELKNFYSGKEDKRGKFLWQEKIPTDIGEPVENEETAKYALLVRNVKVCIIQITKDIMC
jgi:hypothetical protein